jgi:hypothetical protein
VDGSVYGTLHVAPTHAFLGVTVGDMQAAYTYASGRASATIVTELGGGNIDRMMLAPGLYKWSSNVESQLVSPSAAV